MEYVERTAKVDQEYAQRQVKVGQRFHVEQQDVQVLLILGRIEPVDGEAGFIPPTTYRTRELKARKVA